jgi:hypothetical protein
LIPLQRMFGMDWAEKKGFIKSETVFVTPENLEG